MKSLKKVIIIVLTATMLATALSLPASAAVSNPGIKVLNRVEEIKFQLAQAIADVANAQIERLVAVFQAMPNPNIQALVTATNAISSAAIAVINALGFDAVCEYVTYEVGGQLVEIDPIIVIPIGEE
ncbi:MAG TPA: hypothetical protein GX011_03915 [Clostridiales bacterium]|jgi:hypothetical protein|nr:hypothetical protein [Clostridiales bacterium]